MLEESSATSAGNLEWIIQNCIDTKGLSGGALYDYLAELAQGVDPGDSEVYYLPFLYGSNAHPLAKACFVGMTSYHTTAHMVRAVYEGVTYSHRTHIDKLLTVAQKPECIRMAGGAVNSGFWVRMFADVLNCPIETVTGVKELGALGCAMAACVAGASTPAMSKPPPAWCESRRPFSQIGPSTKFTRKNIKSTAPFLRPWTLYGQSLPCDGADGGRCDENEGLSTGPL